jgi:DNA polymerase
MVAVPVPVPPVHPVADSSKQERLQELAARISSCRQCQLAETRTNAVPGDGNPDSRILFVGEAPGYHEDQQGLPFVGQAGKLLEKLLNRIGMNRGDVFIANVLKCRPPDNRDPQAGEIEVCRSFLAEQIDIIEPDLVCTMGNFSTKLLSNKADGISRVHGQPQPLPGHENTRLFPVFHPAAALYTPSNLTLLENDFEYLVTLLPGEKAQSEVEASAEETNPETEASNGKPEPEQLGLF